MEKYGFGQSQTQNKRLVFFITKVLTLVSECEFELERINPEPRRVSRCKVFETFEILSSAF